jgi:hypothetical protein
LPDSKFFFLASGSYCDGDVSNFNIFLQTLLRGPNPSCQQDALIALHDLSLSIEIPVDQLPFQTILDFLNEKWPIEERNAAVGLLDLMVKDKAVSADEFVKTKGVLEATLNLLEKDPDSPGSQKSASALLEMAKEDASVRLWIAESDLRGLDILVKYVMNHMKDPSRIKFKELLTATLVLFCGSEEACQVHFTFVKVISAFNGLRVQVSVVHISRGQRLFLLMA